MDTFGDNVEAVQENRGVAASPSMDNRFHHRVGRRALALAEMPRHHVARTQVGLACWTAVREQNRGDASPCCRDGNCDMSNAAHNGSLTLSHWRRTVVPLSAFTPLVRCGGRLATAQLRPAEPRAGFP